MNKGGAQSLVGIFVVVTSQRRTRKGCSVTLTAIVISSTLHRKCEERALIVW